MFKKWFALIESLIVTVRYLAQGADKILDQLIRLESRQRDLTDAIVTNVAIASLRTLDVGDCSTPGLRTLIIHDRAPARMAPIGGPGWCVDIDAQPYRPGMIVGARWVGDPLAWRVEAREGDVMLSESTEPLAAITTLLQQRASFGRRISLTCTCLHPNGAIEPTVVLFIRETPSDLR